MDIDFIEYSFNNNIDYILIDFTEDFKIENNIFGYYLKNIIIFDYTDGINYYDWKSGRLLDLDLDSDSDDYIRSPEENILKIEFPIEENFLYLSFMYKISAPINQKEFNEFCYVYNNKYDINCEEISQEEDGKNSPEYYYI